MITIHLNDLKFFAFHGVQEEEKVLGNDFLVDCSLCFYEQKEVIRHIDETVDYTQVYQVIQKHMNTPALLLETVVLEIGNDLAKQFKELKEIEISIRKLHPPIEGFQGKTGVSWHKKF